MARRVLLVVAAALLLGLWAQLPASADVAECAFDEGAAIATVTPADGSVVIEVDAGAITVDGLACGPATITNTDTVDVAAISGDTVTISLEGGTFSPGATDEGDGSSEIEFTFPLAYSSEMTILGSAGPDHVTAGLGPTPAEFLARNTADWPAFNFNADESVPDIDMTIVGTPSFLVDLRAGDDVYSGAGIGSAPPISYPHIIVFAGGGDDTVSVAGGSHYLGGAGEDILSFAWLPTSCTSQTYTGGGFVRCPEGDATFVNGRFERFVGHAGQDWLVGDGGDDIIRARGGDDQLWASRSNGILDGGPGIDLAIWDETRRVHADLREGSATLGGGWVQVVEGIEGLYGSRFDDVLIGDGGANRLFGSDGDDVLVGKGGIDVISGGLGTDACDLGLPGTGETIGTCEE